MNYLVILAKLFLSLILSKSCLNYYFFSSEILDYVLFPSIFKVSEKVETLENICSTSQT